MSKKQIKILTVFLILLVVGITVLVLINKKDSGKEKKESTVPESELLLSDSLGDIKGLKLTSGDFELDLVYSKERKKWLCADDAVFPVDTTKINTLVQSLKTMKKLREITDYADLSDFSLDKPAFSAEISAGAEKQKLSFSALNADKGIYYCAVSGDEKVYLVDKDIYTYGENTKLLDYAKAPDNPDFSPSKVKSITVDVKDGNKIVIVPGDVAPSEGSAGEWYYYVVSDGESVNDRKKCTQNDANVLFNFLTGLCYNRIIEYNPSEERLEFYGLKEPAAVVTIQFRGYVNITKTTDNGQTVEELGETEFSYKFYMGNEIKESSGEYFIMNTCESSVDYDNPYDGRNCVFATNSYFAKFFIEMTADNLNGVVSGK